MKRIYEKNILRSRDMFIFLNCGYTSTKYIYGYNWGTCWKYNI